MAKLVRHRPSEPMIAGSNPAGGILCINKVSLPINIFQTIPKHKNTKTHNISYILLRFITFDIFQKKTKQKNKNTFFFHPIFILTFILLLFYTYTFYTYSYAPRSLFFIFVVIANHYRFKC